jgi:hypothetical protein
MFRDPRGIIHALSKSSGQTNLKYATGIRKYARSLCSRMSDDFEAGTKLAALYPKRFKMILFEDFRVRLFAIIQFIYITHLITYYMFSYQNVSYHIPVSRRAVSCCAVPFRTKPYRIVSAIITQLFCSA